MTTSNDSTAPANDAPLPTPDEIRGQMQTRADALSKQIAAKVRERDQVNDAIRTLRAQHAEAERIVKALTPKAARA